MKYTYMFYSHETGLTKIGRTQYPQQRFKSLGGKKRLTLINVTEGDTEKETHERYSEHRVTGEWFRLSARTLRSLMVNNEIKELPEGDIANNFANRYRRKQESENKPLKSSRTVKLDINGLNEEASKMVISISNENKCSIQEAVIILANKIAKEAA